MSIKHLYKIAFCCIGLVSCSNLEQNEKIEAPSKSIIKNIAVGAYTKKYAKMPNGLKVEGLSIQQVFFERKDYVVCISTKEIHTDRTWHINGAVKSNPGDKYTERHAMLIRQYDYGWGAGLFKPSGAKIGAIRVNDICAK